MAGQYPPGWAGYPAECPATIVVKQRPYSESNGGWLWGANRKLPSTDMSSRSAPEAAVCRSPCAHSVHLLPEAAGVNSQKNGPSALGGGLEEPRLLLEEGNANGGRWPVRHRFCWQFRAITDATMNVSPVFFDGIRRLERRNSLKGLHKSN